MFLPQKKIKYFLGILGQDENKMRKIWVGDWEEIKRWLGFEMGRLSAAQGALNNGAYDWTSGFFWYGKQCFMYDKL